MNSRLELLTNQLTQLLNEAYEKYPWLSYDNPLFKENNEEWNRLNSLHDKAIKKWMNFYKKHRKEMDNLTIEENKANGVYWDREDWIYDLVKTIKQDFSLTGQERTAKFVETLNSYHGCICTEMDAGYELEIFTPYKVYLYTFKRGYGDYPIHIEKGYIAPGGNTYRNKIFLASSTADMKANYHNHE